MALFVQFNFITFITFISIINVIKSDHSPPWHSAFVLEDNTTIFGWNDNNFELSLSSPFLCLTIDFQEGLHCIKSENNYQRIPFSLKPGEHILHISKDMSTTPIEIAIYVEPYNHTIKTVHDMSVDIERHVENEVDQQEEDSYKGDGLKVMFLSPAYGTPILLDDMESEIAKASLEVFFSVIETNNRNDEKKNIEENNGVLPFGTMIIISLSGQGEFIVKDSTNNFILSGIEPGTHRITAQVVSSDVRRIPLGCKTDLVFEATFTPKVLKRHQYNVDMNSAASSTVRNANIEMEKKAPSKIKNMFSSLFNVNDKGIQNKPKVRPGEKIKLTFVGSLKFDGQRAIWLHQMHYLSKLEFHIVFVTFTRDNLDQPVLDLLKEYNITLIIKPFPPVETEEIAQSFIKHYNDYVQARSADSDKFPFWLLKSRESSGYSGALTEVELEEILPRNSEALNQVH